MTLRSYQIAMGLSDRELAAMLGVSDEMVRLLRHGKRQISATRAVSIFKITGIPLHELRPDLWEPPAAAPPPPHIAANDTAKSATKRTHTKAAPPTKPKRTPRAEAPTPDEQADAA
jgi:DNA-binding transcriptional regulator YdaS (Cro superfamily)